jgi:hypothetical protein
MFDKPTYASEEAKQQAEEEINKKAEQQKKEFEEIVNQSMSRYADAMRSTMVEIMKGDRK